MGEPCISFSDLTDEDLKSLPSAFYDLEPVVGGETALKLCLAFRGTHLYFPKLEDLHRKIRNRKIRLEFNGSNHARLALKYNLSDNQIWVILRSEPDDRQASLF